MEQIVFYWQGSSLEIPKILVKSILLSNNGLRIIQISDDNTKKIEGVDKIIRVKKTENILMDRLMGYSLIETLNNKNIFLDADTIILKKIDFNEFLKGKYLYKRTTSQIFNSKYNTVYPELANKETIDTMPFLAGLVIINNEKNFFKELSLLSISLNTNLKKWFGDQILLKSYYDQNSDNFNFIDNSFMNIVETNKFSNKININLTNKFTAITFKGATKKYMKSVFEAMISKNFYKN